MNGATLHRQMPSGIEGATLLGEWLSWRFGVWLRDNFDFPLENGEYMIVPKTPEGVLAKALVEALWAAHKQRRKM